MRIVGLDPGRQKIGAAVVCGETGCIMGRAIVATKHLEELSLLLRQWDFQYLAVGNATGGAELLDKLRELQGQGLIPEVPITLVEERNSTLEARSLYWEAFPPSGWRRLVPLSMQTPPVPIDDFAAAVLARRAEYTPNGSSQETVLETP